MSNTNSNNKNTNIYWLSLLKTKIICQIELTPELILISNGRNDVHTEDTGDGYDRSQNANACLLCSRVFSDHICRILRTICSIVNELECDASHNHLMKRKTAREKYKISSTSSLSSST